MIFESVNHDSGQDTNSSPLSRQEVKSERERRDSEGRENERRWNLNESASVVYERPAFVAWIIHQNARAKVKE